MSRAELDAARIDGPELRASYQRCRALHERHGRTYFLATRLLPPARRPAIHALYGFARWADDIVDGESGARPGAERALAEVEDQLERGLRDGSGEHPVVAAVVDTARRYALDPELFRAFMASMRMDLTVTGYADFAALRRYMYGSAAVIGLMVLPVLGTAVPRERAAPHAAALGEAFQLTNFLRDVAEDLDRGRVYLPADMLAAHGVDRDRLLWCRARRQGDPAVRAALAEVVALNRSGYREAAPGVPMLAPASRPCVATAFTLYQGILDEIESADYDVWSARRAVPVGRRLRVALPAVARTVAARLTAPPLPAPTATD
ncbi:phytoene/squalene synthase family protein [Allonocardiopsis opalescens]|uniref:Phytoene synthase n=1 Tax=Allonocardiopsis opalescens TaxID=1144618 RepID=A0A2T0QEC0_9ACTN|nr:phytoene/squalene synthase family protein [Allonocardiopsis opalescens]PRY02242.1 phytoene synthase [Allonocardiopsis opalescens]